MIMKVHLVSNLERFPLRLDLSLPLRAPLVLQLLAQVTVNVVTSSDWDSIAGRRQRLGFPCGPRKIPTLPWSRCSGWRSGCSNLCCCQGLEIFCDWILSILSKIPNYDVCQVCVYRKWSAEVNGVWIEVPSSVCIRTRLESESAPLNVHLSNQNASPA